MLEGEWKGGNDCRRVAGDGVRGFEMEIHVLIVAGSLSWDTYVEEVLILKELEPGANDPVGIHHHLATSILKVCYLATATAQHSRRSL